MAFLKRLSFGEFHSDLPDVYTKEEINHKEQSINNNFSNYYTKNETYTQIQVDNLLSQVQGSKYVEVNSLPATGEPQTIYLVPGQGGSKEQWIYSNGNWINIGSTAIDMSQYVHKNEVVDMIHPVGDTVIRTDNIDPGTLYSGTTWQKISEGKVLIGANSTYPLGSSADGTMSHNHTNPITGGSSAANTGGTTLTAAQSGLPSHNHTQNAHSHYAANDTNYRFLNFYNGGDGINLDVGQNIPNGDGEFWYPRVSVNVGTFGSQVATRSTTATNNSVAAANATQAHSHTMAHTHTQGNTGNTTIPYLAVNIWIRTA